MEKRRSTYVRATDHFATSFLWFLTADFRRSCRKHVKFVVAPNRARIRSLSLLGRTSASRAYFDGRRSKILQQRVNVFRNFSFYP